MQHKHTSCTSYRHVASDPNKPLEGMKFAIVGKKFLKDKKVLKEKVQELGGQIVKKIAKDTAAVITTPGKTGYTCSGKVILIILCCQVF